MTRQPVEYQLLDGRILASDELETLTAEDWRFLFWLSLETQRDQSLASMIDMISGHAASEPRAGATRSAGRLIALDVVERATRGAATIAEFRHNGFVTVREAAAIRGVSRQSVNRLVRDGKVAFVRRGGLVLIDRRSIGRLQRNSRKRTSGRQILMVPNSVPDRLGPGTGFLCGLDRPVLEHVMLSGDFSFCILRPGARLSDSDLDSLERLRVERKGGEAYLDWLAAGGRERDTPDGVAPPLPRTLRHVDAWRFRFPPEFADKPVPGELLKCADGGLRSMAVLHYVSIDDWGYLDVSFDATSTAVEILRRNARKQKISSQPTAELLNSRPAGSIWCDSLAGRFAASLKRAIQGEPESGSPMVGDAVFELLLGVVEANYPFTLGLAAGNYWIDRRATAALAGTRLGGPEMSEARSAVSALRKRIQGTDFEKSLAEFRGLGLLAERLGWSTETVVERIPRIIDQRRWSRYVETAGASPAPKPRRARAGPVAGL